MHITIWEPAINVVLVRTRIKRRPWSVTQKLQRRDVWRHIGTSICTIWMKFARPETMTKLWNGSKEVMKLEICDVHIKLPSMWKMEMGLKEMLLSTSSI